MRGSAIYHLHGQHTGFLLLNTRKLLEDQAKRIEPALKEATEGRTVIVCGYSGENDPLVDRISRQDVYPHGLIWVCHDGKDPCPQVMKVLGKIEDCHIAASCPRPLVTHLGECARSAALSVPDPDFRACDRARSNRPYGDLSETGFDLLQHARALLEAAEDGQDESGAGRGNIAELMAQEKYNEILSRYGRATGDLDKSGRDLVAWSAIMKGIDLANQAKAKEGDDADLLFGEAIEQYASALAINSDKFEALNNWGVVLADQSKLKRGRRAEHCSAKPWRNMRRR